MERINLKENVWADLDIEELLGKIESFRIAGFGYFPFDEIFYTSARVKLPSGEIVTINDIEKKLPNLEIGNLRQIELIQAGEFYQICQAYY